MRVVIDAAQAGNRSGTGRYTQELIRALRRVAPELRLVALWPHTVELRHADPGLEIVRRGKSPLARIIASCEPERFLRGPFDLIHYPANFGALWPRRPNVVTVHDLSFLREPAWFKRDRALYYRFLARHTLHRATRLIADSQATRNDCIELLRLDPARIDVIPLGVSEHFAPATPEAIAEARRAYRLPEHYLLYVGTLEPRKNLPRVIEAWSRAAGRIPHHLVIAGRDGWKTDAIRAAAARSPHAARIHFPGYIATEYLAGAVSGARAFVWPSLFEGFGLPPLEAMACGTPVITSNTSSLPEVVAEAALTVDPEDPAALERAIEQLATGDALHATLREAGLARAAQFTWDHTARLTLKTYERAYAR